MSLRLAIGLLSGAALAYQILLMRLFSIVQWHHFAYMVISLALLGYGASGAVLTVLRRPLLERFESAFVVFAACFSLLGPGCFALSQRLGLNPLEILWSPRQLGVVAAVYLILALPFFCAGSAVGLALARFGKSPHQIYRADLVGAAAGALGAIGSLYLWLPATGLRLVGLAGALAAAMVFAAADRQRAATQPWRLGSTRKTLPFPGALLAAALLLPALWPAAWLEPPLSDRISEYKPLPRALAVPGAEILAERSSPLGLLTAVASPRVPFRFAPGLSLSYSGEVPEQIVVFRDGDVAAVVDRAAAPGASAYLSYLPAALPFELLRSRTPHEREPSVTAERIAVLGAGAGTGLSLARSYASPTAEIHAVELDSRMLDLWSKELAAFAGHPFSDPRVRSHVVDPRGFLGAERAAFDLILMPSLETGASSGAASSLQESYAHTVEAFALGLERASADGLLAVEGEIAAPPRLSLKLVATAAEALEESGLEPGRHLLVIRSWSRFLVVLSRSLLEPQDLETLRTFSAERSFDLAFYPGMNQAEANRFHLLDEPDLFRGIQALLGPERGRLLRGYKFDIRPATDDRPHAQHFFRWRTLGELLALRTAGGAAQLEWASVLLLVTLVQAALAGLVLILLPLWWVRRRAPRPSEGGAGRVGVYFLCLGLAFLFLEIAFIQKLTLLLAHPLLAAAVVLAGFLFFAGLGSGASRRWAKLVPRAPIRLAAVAIVAVALAELALLARLFTIASAWPLAPRLAVALATIAPLAFLLGMPFPLGLRRVAVSRPDLVPWAWGVNGWASVLAAVLATLLAIQFGFSAIVLGACALYLVAASAAPAR